MTIREQLIHFQNKAEQDYLEQKNMSNLLGFIAALIVFFSSTLIAAFTLPFRWLSNAIGKKENGSPVRKMDADNIDRILKKEPLVLIDFWAAWCGPCMIMNPTIEKFAGNNSGICVAKVNADSNKALTDRFKIRGLPQLILLQNGLEIKRHAGPMTEADLRKFCLVESNNALVNS